MEHKKKPQESRTAIYFPPGKSTPGAGEEGRRSSFPSVTHRSESHLPGHTVAPRSSELCFHMDPEKSLRGALITANTTFR